jgi:hypothetical protein
MTAPRDILPAALPLTIHQSLARMTTPKDTVHSYRFRPASDLSVTAVVVWVGGGEITTMWEDCSNRTFPGAPLTVGGVVVDQAGNALPASQVILMGTALSAITGSQGQFLIAGVPAGWQGTLRGSRVGYATTDRPAAEGRAGHWLMLPPPGPPPPPFAPQTNTGPSPNSSSLLVPGGACRLLSVVKTDSTTAAMIARLRLTTP